jgi:hypothetical protein
MFGIRAESAPESGRVSIPLVALGVVWIFLVGTGFAILEHEQFTPVTHTIIATDFPSGSGIELARDKPTLIVFAHPQCPCTRATLHDLDVLRASTRDKVAVVMVFTIPPGVPTGWEKGDLWNSTAAMHDVRVVRDQDGLEANRFHVKGSGHVLLYNPAGHLLFSGGITDSRGHEGDNAGQSAVVSLVLTGHASINHTAVFGCSLL